MAYLNDRRESGIMFSLIGDSNVTRNISRMSRRASPAMRSAEVISCGTLELFESSLGRIRSESDVCIVSCLTNFVTSASGSETISLRVEPVFQRISQVLTEACQASPNRSFMVSPPMYRTNPIWYRDGLPEILSTFSSVLLDQKPPNLHLMSSYPTPEFETDGVHLSGLSGLEFVVSLFDSAEDLLEQAKKAPSVRCDVNAQQTRVLEDRMMVLEQDHRRLNRFVEKKSAVDAELADYRENERLEDSFVISGLERLPSSLSGKEWHSQAVSKVQTVIRQLMGREMEILVVQNVTSRKPDSETTYNVKMASVEDSRALRRKFGTFFQGGKDGRPTEFSSLSIKNRVTPETKIRISIMKLMAKRYKDSNPGSIVRVIGYDPRPLLKIIPPSSSSDRRTRTYNYIQACRSLPTTFSASDLDPILRRVPHELRGSIRSTFIVLNDDQLRAAPAGGATAPATGSNSEAASLSVEQGDPDQRRGVRRSANSPPGSPSATRARL